MDEGDKRSNDMLEETHAASHGLLEPLSMELGVVHFRFFFFFFGCCLCLSVTVVFPPAPVYRPSSSVFFLFALVSYSRPAPSISLYTTGSPSCIGFGGRPATTSARWGATQTRHHAPRQTPGPVQSISAEPDTQRLRCTNRIERRLVLGHCR